MASQEQELRAWVAREGDVVVGVTTDNDRSASRTSKARPGYREIHRQMEAGTMDVLGCWESSRAQRDLKAYVQTRDLCEQHGVLFAYKGRIYNLSRTDDRFSTGLDALLDERYADEVKDRVRRGVSTSLSRGTARGKIPFGYQRTYDPGTGAMLDQTPNPATAPIVAELFARIAAGESLYAIAADLNRRGVPTPQAHRDARRGVTAVRGGWTSSKIRRQVSNPQVAGFRVHQGNIQGEAGWDPLVPADQWAAVQHILSNPNRRTQRGVAPKFLLSGILECGVCGARCRHTVNRGHSSYACHGKNYNNLACVSGRKVPIDDFVTVALLARLNAPDIFTVLAEASGESERAAASAELRNLEARLAQFEEAALLPDGPSPAFLMRMQADYLPRIAEARARATPRWLPSEVIDLATGDANELWPEMSTVVQRRVVSAFMRVTLNKSTRPRGSHGFDHSRIRIDWRTG